MFAWLVVVLLCNFIYGEGIRQLTAKTHDELISVGMQLVKYYSPSCHHCQAFAPTYELLGRDALKHGDKIQINELDCSTYFNKCVEQHVTSFPTLMMYEDGKLVEEYNGERSLDALNALLHKYAKLTEKQKQGEQLKQSIPEIHNALYEKASFKVYNTDGKVIDLTRGNIALVESGMWMIDFFSPSCGHCKALEPTWKDFALLMKAKMNVAKVDCSSESLCSDFNIRGYPTIYFVNNGNRKVFSSGRSIQALTDFASKVLRFFYIFVFI
jgi:thioredoxin domain-containing protein 5